MNLKQKLSRHAIRYLPDDAAGGRVSIIVDNTTVRNVARKGACANNAVINDAVAI